MSALDDLELSRLADERDHYKAALQLMVDYDCTPEVEPVNWQIAYDTVMQIAETALEGSETTP